MTNNDILICWCQMKYAKLYAEYATFSNLHIVFTYMQNMQNNMHNMQNMQSKILHAKYAPPSLLITELAWFISVKQMVTVDRTSSPGLSSWEVAAVGPHGGMSCQIGHSCWSNVDQYSPAVLFLNIVHFRRWYAFVKTVCKGGKGSDGFTTVSLHTYSITWKIWFQCDTKVEVASVRRLFSVAFDMLECAGICGSWQSTRGFISK